MTSTDAAFPRAARLAVFGRRYAAGILLVLVFGLARLPFERGLARERSANSINSVRLDLSMRERISQNEFIAALGGFRSLVADLLWIEVQSDWERVEYGKMNLKFGTVTTLVPHNVMFWDMSGWHMAYNASVAVMDDEKEPKLAIRKKRQQEYFELGKDYIDRGIANNPQARDLYQMLAKIDAEKLGDHLGASEAYDMAAKCPHAFGYERRFAAYELAKVPGREREAWQRLRSLYDEGPHERLPTLETDLRATRTETSTAAGTKGLQNLLVPSLLKDTHALCDLRRHSREP